MAAVPRVFHFVFGLKEQVQPFSLMHYLALRSCLEVNRPRSLHVHYQHMPWGPLWERIQPYLELRHLPQELPLSAYDYGDRTASEAFRYAHSSDFLRVEILNREGGVYADMDTLFLAPYPDELYGHDFVMGHETVDPHVTYAHSGGSLCNALFFCAPGAAFATAWRREMGIAFDGHWSRHSTFLPFELSQRHPQTIHVEPSTSFFHLDWTPEGIRDLFERNVRLPACAYSLHLWAHLWTDRKRTDVTRFHEGRLTADYIRYADTTFAHHARQWLPDDLPTKSSVAWRATQYTQAAGDGLLRSADWLRSVAGRAAAAARRTP